MRKQSKEFLVELLSTPSPSGFEAPGSRVYLDYLAPYADEMTTDVHGNAMAVINPGGSPRVMLAGHVDQIGLMVSYINADGYLYFCQIGGHDAVNLVGQRVLIHAEKKTVLGVIGRKPIHLLEADERTKAPKMKDLWIDIGVKNKKEAEKLVAVGDPVTFDVAYRDMASGRAISAAFDDKAGVFVVAEAARLLSGMKPKAAVYAVATVGEEVGLRGARTSAFGVDPQIGIAVDVTFASDCPGSDSREIGEISLGKGPVIERGSNFNNVLVDRMVAAARRKKMPYQMKASGNPPGTDANAIQVTRAGVATGLVSVPNRYMHSVVEMVDLGDLEKCAQLIAETVAEIDNRTDFHPVRAPKKKS